MLNSITSTLDKESLDNYIDLYNHIYDCVDLFRNGCTVDGIVALAKQENHQEMIERLTELQNYLGKNCSDESINMIINEWNTNVVPILTGVTCNSFEEFAMQVANVAGQCIKYKSAKEAMPQQPVQPQQNQMFVDVNTLVSENTYLRSLNASKDEEIKSLRERLVALGQPV